MDEDVVRLLARDVAEEQIIVAPRAFLYRLFAGVNARKVAMREQCPYQPCFTRTALRASGSSGLLWGVVIDDVEGARDGRYGPLFQSMLAVPEQYPEYSRIPTLGSTLVLKFRPTSADPAGQTP